MQPPWESRMQRESPTEATVTVHPSIITNVTVVPEVSPGNANSESVIPDDTSIPAHKQYMALEHEHAFKSLSERSETQHGRLCSNITAGNI